MTHDKRERQDSNCMAAWILPCSAAQDPDPCPCSCAYASCASFSLNACRHLSLPFCALTSCSFLPCGCLYRFHCCYLSCWGCIKTLKSNSVRNGKEPRCCVIIWHKASLKCADNLPPGALPAFECLFFFLLFTSSA